MHFFILALLLADTTAPATPSPAIAIDQLGFYPHAPKYAIVTGPAPGDIFFIVKTDGSSSSFTMRGDTVFFGHLGPMVSSANSSLTTRIADFSEFHRPGTYRVVVPGFPNSFPFTIGARVFSPVAAAALRGYYYQRSSIPLTSDYAGQWARGAGHPDTQVVVHPSAADARRPAGTVIATPGGWYDAGDYNKYIVNSGITMGTLLNAWEDFHDYFDTLHTNIPPVGGGAAGGGPAGARLPDLLNEVLYNLRWMLMMQDPGDGGVYHKCTNADFDGMVMPGVTKATRYVVQKGTAATLDFAAVMAHAGRVYSQFTNELPGLADSCRAAAIRAWQWAQQYPDSAYNQNALNRSYKPAINTGAYGDQHFEDERFWAACELWVTVGGTQYYPVIAKHFDDAAVIPSWANVGMMGDLTLLHYLHIPTLRDTLEVLRQKLLKLADTYVSREPGTAFHTVMGENRWDFVWGSNSVAANQGMLLVNAWLLTKEQRYLDAALDNFDYLLGRNATGYCFITGMGSRSPLHPHHRPSISDGIVPPVPGLLAGGPNPGMQDHQAYVYKEPETAYIDNDQAYASNEIAINWNAPLVYLAGALEASQYRAGYSFAGEEVAGNTVPADRNGMAGGGASGGAPGAGRGRARGGADAAGTVELITSGGKAADDLFISLLGGPDAKVIFIPTAASSLRSDGGVVWNPDEEKNREEFRAELMKRFGLRNITILHTRDRKVAGSKDFVSPLFDARAVWIAGGNPGRFMAAYKGTLFEKELKIFLQHGGIVAGESAGAVVQGSFTIRGNPNKPILMVKGHEKGLGLLQGIAIDPHLTATHREDELDTVVRKHRDLLGIGIDDNTGMIIRDGIGEVFGSGRIAIYDPKKIKEEKYYWLKPGDRFDLRSRSVVRVGK